MTGAQRVALKLIDFYRDHAWTRGEFARDAEGGGVMAESKDAVSWCMLGAMEKLGISKGLHDNYQTQLPDSLFHSFQKVLPENYSGSIAGFNDSSLGTREKVLEALRKVAKGGE